MKKNTVLLLIIIMALFNGCEKETQERIRYTIYAKVFNDQTQNRISDIKVVLGTKDTGISADFDQICENVGTEISDINGECIFEDSSYAGEPEICSVRTSNVKGESLNNTYFYDIKKRELFIYVKFN